MNPNVNNDPIYASGGSSTSLLTSCGSAPIEAQRETRRVSIMQKWKGGNRKTSAYPSVTCTLRDSQHVRFVNAGEQVHKKMTRVQRNQERAEYQRVKLHLKQVHSQIVKQKGSELTSSTFPGNALRVHRG